MCCFVILLLFNEMQMSVRRFSAIPHLRGTRTGTQSLPQLHPKNTNLISSHKQIQTIMCSPKGLHLLEDVLQKNKTCLSTKQIM